MRTFELVEGTAAKFWSVEVAGSTVTVQFGRIGTAGQTQVKELGSAEAASAQAEKLVAAKVKKGYVEQAGGAAPAPAPVTSSAAAAPASRASGPAARSAASPPAAVRAPAPSVDEQAALPNEDTFVVPVEWYRIRFPRRNSPGLAAPAAPSKAAARKAAAALADYAKILKDRPAVTRSHDRNPGFAFAADPATGTPLGAAQLLDAATAVGQPSAAGDGLLALYQLERGLPFVALALVERRPGMDRLIKLARTAIAAADDAQRDAVTSALEARLAGDANGVHNAALLVPERADWLDGAIAAVHRLPDWEARRHHWELLASVSTSEQMRVLGTPRDLYNFGDRATLVTFVEALGPAAAPFLATMFDVGWSEASTKRQLLDLLVVLPGDEAFVLLLDRAENRDALAAVQSAARRFPARAVRLLAAAGSDLLGPHVLAHPDVAQAVLPELPPESAALVAPLLGAQSSVVEAAPDDVPSELSAAVVPVAPDWANPAGLARPELLAGGALPIEATRALVALLAKGELPPAVRSAVDPAGLAEFGWSLFEGWRNAGMPPADKWALTSLGLVGDDTTVARLTPVIRDWPGQNGHHRAVMGLDVLAGIGTDKALMALHGIAQKLKFKALKERAGEKMAEVAKGLGLTAEQLGDRLVPTFGLDADGSTTLDYGPREFRVGFDEQLKPYVVGFKTLPKPGAKDDPELAPAAYARFAALKKDVRAIAASELLRLERAMVTQRRWNAAEFREFFAGHPLVFHLARRLVWARYDVDAMFRIAEDRTYADSDDKPVELPADAVVGIPHPLDGDLMPWGDVFADYEILQPFAQLNREVHLLTGDEPDATELTRFAGVKVPTGRVLGLEKYGWRRATPQDNGIQPWVELSLPDGRTAALDLDPGIVIGMMDLEPQQTLERLRIQDGPVYWFQKDGRVPLGDVDPVTMSELIHDLERLTQ